MAKVELVFSGPVTSRSGYGSRSRDLVVSLMKMDKYDIRIFDTSWGGCSKDALKTEDPHDIQSLICKPELHKKPQVWVQVSTPLGFQPMGLYNIGITAGIETDRVIPKWLQQANKMDLLLVSSEHSKNGFVNPSYDVVDNGVKRGELKCDIPVEVLFEGLDVNVYNKKSTDSMDKTLKQVKEDFCYLYVGHWLPGEFGHDRKNTGLMIRTFLEAFKNKAPRNQPALILKTSSATTTVTDREDILGKIEQIKTSIGSKKLPKIYLLHGNLTVSEMNDLYNHKKIKAMISMTHGEGFGRPLLEFGATGKPIIASGWSGHMDFLKEHSILINGQMSQVHKSTIWQDFINEDAQWFYPDPNHAFALMNDVYGNYKLHTSKSRKQPKYVKDNFTLDHMTTKFSSILDANIPSFEIKIPKLEEI